MRQLAASFSGHESFPFRNTWLTKGVKCCLEDPTIFAKNDALVTLGVGKNMVRSIRNWCLATRVLEETPNIKNNHGRHLRPTELGRKIFAAKGGWDPFLEDIGTLWLIHWLLATNKERATTWYFAFNEFHQPEFTKYRLEHAISDFVERLPKVRVAEGTVRRDVDVLIRTYVGSQNTSAHIFEESLNCPLVDLGLIFEQPVQGLYAFARGPKDSLPDAVLIFALWEYLQGRPDQRSLTFEELAYGAFSPGRVFKLDESSLAERLDNLKNSTRGAWHFSETAGLKQVLLTRNLEAINVLDRYYHRKSITVVGGYHEDQ